MGSNPILAAIYQRKCRASRAPPLPRGCQVLPDFYRPGAASSLGPDDPVEVSGGSALVLLVRVNVCAQRQRAAVGVAELRGDERLSSRYDVGCWR
jgi:hypothetical protein